MSDDPAGRLAAYTGPGMEVAASTLVLGYGVVLDRVLPDFSHVPANLAAAAAAVYLASLAGVSLEDMGLERSRLAPGLKAGLYSVAPIAAAVAVGVALPWSRRFFLDGDVVNASTGRALYEMLVRIPLATALAEELIFRGALLGLFLQRHEPRAAVAFSSTVFGLWHISPTLQSIVSNPAAGSAAASGAWARLGIVAGLVAATAAAGAVFAWLRLKSGSIAAPWIAHTSLNSLSYLGGRVAAGFDRSSKPLAAQHQVF